MWSKRLCTSCCVLIRWRVFFIRRLDLMLTSQVKISPGARWMCGMNMADVGGADFIFCTYFNSHFSHMPWTSGSFVIIDISQANHPSSSLMSWVGRSASVRLWLLMWNSFIITRSVCFLGRRRRLKIIQLLVRKKKQSLNDGHWRNRRLIAVVLRTTNPLIPCCFTPSPNTSSSFAIVLVGRPLVAAATCCVFNADTQPGRVCADIPTQPTKIHIQHGVGLTAGCWYRTEALAQLLNRKCFFLIPWPP